VLGTPIKHVKSLLGAQFSADGSRILTWSWDGKAHLWDSVTGGKALPSPLRHDKSVRGAQFSPDGSRILTWTSDDRVWLWAVDTGEQTAPPMSQTSPIRGAQFGAGVSRVLTWNEDGTARLWDSRTGVAITPPMTTDSPVRSARFDADESRVWTQGEDGSARSWDIAIDKEWPVGEMVLRTEVETGTKLTSAGELKAIDPAEWQGKRWCDYDAIRHDRGRLIGADWAESERLCLKARAGPVPSP
jgi:WD40 repeat protein